ncbi:LEAF RUST 10 DISEASE-RESISTANCE LOCUS RECEPTOR-LIKE PROTEIN KINASE-like 1.2 isoform X6 [Magnolia sinica]|uniref:LEAF RUST 10 DISEASE-RESISTANCE LOCUS RECEPTOR-LIKE PROTEIN KINASE-like 1.2 isoform X6 n=1 Tax=Magnolia sinica TaxID=86752 RepID=UPI00265B6361|nr:LEAF RUST 10 DISEASE-RESISTANCE LOCUS RECEPTOR-LIKE PROTEIN KINASE-like 1.2 isoform X6 [Magnolia sinica]
MPSSQPLILSFSSSIIIIFVFTFFLLQGRAKSIDQRFEACVPQSCGNHINISFPFWIDPQPFYCGFPGFKLSCKNDQPVLKISDDDDNYYIREIFYNNQSLSVFNEEYLQGPCPHPIHNLTFTRTRDPLNVSTQNFQLYFYYNCTAFPPREYEVLPVSCISNNTHDSFVMVDYNRSFNSLNFSRGCESSVIVPVTTGGGLTGALTRPRDYLALLNMGFLLEWTGNNCTRCTGSGGRCGFNETSQFVCFCPDRPHSVACRNGRNGGMDKKKIIVITIGAGALVLFLALLVFLLFRRIRNKNRPSISSNLLSRSISSDPYSKSELEKGIQTQFFEYKELEEATNNFDPSKELGDGGFGTVYHGKLRDGRFVAVKRLYENNYKRVEQFKNEIDILSRLRHRNLVTLYGCSSRHRRELLLVYEFIPNGTVADHLHGDRVQAGTLTWSIRMSIAVETADALAYLHKVEIIHRDVKTNNILLDNNFCVKVADFGLSRLFPLDVTHVSTAPQGTPGYVDPDYHRCYQLTDRSDVYSFGVVLIELISSMPAVDISRHRHEINLASMAITKIHNNALHELVDSTLGFDSDFSVRRMITSVAQLAFRCLQEEKEVRPSMEEVLEELRGIESEEYKVEKIEEVGIPVDETALLKNNLPPSPDTVTKAWDSRTTTPNTSG